MLISFLYDYIYAFPLYLITLVLLGDLLRIPEEGIVFYLVSVLVVGLLTSLRNAERSLNILIVGILTVVSLGIVLVQKPGERMVFLQEHLWIGTMLLVGVLVFLVSRWVVFSIWVRLLASMLLAGATVTMLLGFLPTNRLVVSMIFFALLTYLIEWIQLHWEKQGDTDGKTHLVLVAPAVVLLCLAVCLIPVSEKPYDWGFVRNISHRVVQIVKTATRYLPGRSEDYTDVGFSEDTLLAGILQSKPKECIDLTNVRNSNGSIYLAGKYFDSFSGQGWSNRYVQDNHNRLMDTMETLCAVESYDPEYTGDYLNYSGIKLTYQIFNTNYLFAPLKATLSQADLNDIACADRSDALVAEEELGYGSEYIIRYYQLNKDHSEFGNFVSDGGGFDKELWDAKTRGNADLSYENYLKYQADMKAYYWSEIPLSAELQELMDRVYDGTQSKWERMKRLEQWFMLYQYSNEPGELPERVQDGKSFLDYFMLEKREGYCLHFATAFVLLARSEGLPARLAQGYLVNFAGQKEVKVMSNMAHVWPEVYFEGIGWIPFEATPGYFKPVSWKVADRNTEVIAASEEDEQRYEDYREYYLALALEETLSEEIEEDASPQGNLLVIFIPVIFALIFVLLFIGVYRYFMQKKYDALAIYDKAKIMCQRNLQILHFLGYQMVSGETLEEYGRRVIVAIAEMDEEISEEIREYIKIYEELLYGELQVDEDCMQRITHINAWLLEVLRKEKGIMALYYKFILDIRFAS